MELTKENKKIKLPKEISVLIAFAALVVIFSILSPFFLTLRNVMNIFLYTAVIGICATGMTMIIISGGLDISVGSMVGLTGMVSGLVVANTGNVFLAVALGLLTGLICGTINGLVITRLKIVPIIATLAFMSIYRGTALLTTNGQSQLIASDGFKAIGRGYIAEIVPYCVVMMFVIFIIGGYILKFTPFGRKIYSIGGNAEASRLAGINVKNTRLAVYMICGTLTGFSGILTASQTGAAIPSAGSGLEMDVIGSVVLGGVSITGGKGSIIGTFLGVMILATLSNGLTLLNVQSFWQTIAKGIVLVIAVYIDVMRGGGYE